MSRVEKYPKSITIIKRSKKSSQKQKPFISVKKNNTIISISRISKSIEDKKIVHPFKKQIKLFSPQTNDNRQSNRDYSFQRSTCNQTLCRCRRTKNDTLSALDATLQTSISENNNNNTSRNTTLNNKSMTFTDKNIYIQNNGNIFSSKTKKINTNKSSCYNGVIPKILTFKKKPIHLCNNYNINRKLYKKLNLINSSIDMQNLTADNYEHQLTFEDNIRKQWSGPLFIQSIERIQYLAAGSPELQIQFLNDMRINPTIVSRGPIRVLVPLPKNYLQKQDNIEILSKHKTSYTDLCGENVDDLKILKKFDSIPLSIENHVLDINSSKRLWRGKIAPFKICKLNLKKDNWNSLVKVQLANKLNYHKSRNNRQQMFENAKDDNKSSKIDLGNNESTTLTSRKRLLRKMKHTKFKMGGKGFSLWSPVLSKSQSLTIEGIKPKKPEKKDFNKINNIVPGTRTDILTKEKIIKLEQIKSIEALREKEKKDKWNKMAKKRPSFKFGYLPKKKNWLLNITNRVNDLYFQKEPVDAKIHEDDNDNQLVHRRPIQATILKMDEDDETSSVSSYDVFQHLMMKKNLNLNFPQNYLNKNYNEYFFQRNKDIYKGIKYAHIPTEPSLKPKFGCCMDERKKLFKISKCENERKNKYDQYPTIVIKTTMTNEKENRFNSMKRMKERIEIIREDN